MRGFGVQVRFTTGKKNSEHFSAARLMVSLVFRRGLIWYLQHMPLSTDISMPIDRTPRWPARCIRCGTPAPESIFFFRASRVGWDQILTLGWAVGSRPPVEVPACEDCAHLLRRARRARVSVGWLVLLPLGLATLWSLRHFGYLPAGPFRRWASAGILLATFLPAIVLDAIFPPVIDATAQGRTITYEFRDCDFALEFRELND